MPACPGASSEPLSTGPALRLAASGGEAVPSSRADPDRPPGTIPPPVTVPGQLSLESGVPNVARVYDALLGGKDNYAADRDAARRLVAAVPGATWAARANRAFLGRAVRYLTGQGITQYLDIGSGLPTRGNVHQVAHEVSPGARVVYADIDPVVVAHARALLADSPAAAHPKVTAVQADLRYPRHLITSREIRDHLDLDQPVGLLLVAVLHFMTDADRPHDVVRCLAGHLAPGSHVVISHVTADHIGAEAARAAEAVYDGASAPGVTRSRDDIERFLDGLDLVPPGVTDAATWRPGPAPAPGP
ncbi:MAG: SAM-dependent methyltransferase, partial [Actinomycetota bacterium]|nr:SAM-dependent methyltransferase [Actinomycetota bacterium]